MLPAVRKKRKKGVRENRYLTFVQGVRHGCRRRSKIRVYERRLGREQRCTGGCWIGSSGVRPKKEGAENMDVNRLNTDGYC